MSAGRCQPRAPHGRRPRPFDAKFCPRTRPRFMGLGYKVVPELFYTYIVGAMAFPARAGSRVLKPPSLPLTRTTVSERTYAPRFFGSASVRPAPGRKPSVTLAGDDASCFSGVSILALILP